MEYRVKVGKPDKLGKKYKVQKKSIFGWITVKKTVSQGKAMNIKKQLEGKE